MPDCELTPTGRITLQGDFSEGRHLSGVVLWDDRLLLAGDEQSAVQVFRPIHEGCYEFERALSLADDSGMEMDIESLALRGRNVFAIGSHCLARPKVRDRPKDSLQENRRRLCASLKAHSRDHFRRLKLDDQGRPAAPPKELPLAPLLDEHPLLNPFRKIAAKEGGVDIEGLAYFDDRLWVGFRGPLVHGEYALVLVCKEKPLAWQELHFLPLDGLAIRDLCPVDNGLLILAGPMGKLRVPFGVYFWDGGECLPDRGRVASVPRLLARLPLHPGLTEPQEIDSCKPEGLVVTATSPGHIEVLVVHDGPPGGALARYHVPRP